MPKLTPEKRAELEAQLAADDADDDDGDDDVSWYERGPDGAERGATMKTRRAREHGPDWLRSHLAKPADPADGDDAGDGDAGDGKAKKPAAGKDAGNVRRFAAGRRVG